jgi:hypothetical protein
MYFDQLMPVVGEKQLVALRGRYRVGSSSDSAAHPLLHLLDQVEDGGADQRIVGVVDGTKSKVRLVGKRVSPEREHRGSCAR